MPEITVPAVGDQPSFTVEVPDRSGVSPIGTSSPNSGSTAATNSTYAPNAYTSGISVQNTGTSYTIQNTDYQGVVLFNTASAVAVTLNSAVQANFQATILNLGTGAITLTPTLGYTVNGSASVTLGAGQGAQVFFANRAWLAYAGTTTVQVVPQTLVAVSGVYVTGYDATTGTWTISAPPGISATVALAALTALGTQGSLTVVNGLITAYTPPT